MTGLGVVSVVCALAVSAPPSSSSSKGAPARPVYAGAASRGPVDPAQNEAVRLEVARLFAERGVKVTVAEAEAVTEQKKARALAELDERLDEAARAFKKNDYAEAKVFAQEALGIFEEALAYSEDDAGWARYRELLLLVTEAQLNARDKDAADVTLGQLLVIEPDYKPTKTQVSAGLLARLEVVRDNQRATPRTTVEVKSRPPGARVLVDGRRAGKAPVAVEVLPGIHYVSLDDNGKVHRERVIVSEDGGRVTARLGEPEAQAAQTLIRRLKDPLTKKELSEYSVDVADVTLAALIVPWGKSQQVLIARVTDGELDAIVGARLPLRQGPREQALFQLVEAAVTKKADAWVGEVTDDAGTLRTAFLTGAGDQNAVVKEEEEPLNVPLLIGGLVGGVAVAAGVAFGVFTVVQADARKDEGFIYAVDTAGLDN